MDDQTNKLNSLQEELKTIPQSQEVKPIDQSPQVPQPQLQPSPVQPEPKKPNTPLFIGAFLLFLALTSIAGFLYLKNQKLKEGIPNGRIEPTMTPLVSPTPIPIEINPSPDPTPTGILDVNQKGRVNCTSLRPEACTLECIDPPPYLCGSNEKSYCSACQACADKNVDWYITQEEICSR